MCPAGQRLVFRLVRYKRRPDKRSGMPAGPSATCATRPSRTWPSWASCLTWSNHMSGPKGGLAGVYTWEVAETKADQVAALAAEAGYPLRATIEEA